ncbi:ECF-type riboflavin transporter substrate-binding protein [Oenococcus oeni]
MWGNKKSFISVRDVVAIGIGTAVFFVLMRFLAIPTPVSNTTINLGEPWLSLIGAIFGPIVGFLVGFIGHALNDTASGWGVWWTWVFADGVLGLLLGLTKSRLKLQSEHSTKKKIIFFNIWQVVSNAIAWFLIAPLGDIVVYKQPAAKVFLQGIWAGIGNIVAIAIVGTILLVAYSKTRTRSGSLKSED